MNKEMKIKIAGRDATYSKLDDGALKYSKLDDGAWKVVLYQNEGDCPKGKSESERYSCSGNCQNELVFVVFNKDKLHVVAGIFTKTNPVITSVDENLCAKRGYAITPGEHVALCREINRYKRTEIEGLLPDDAKTGYKTFLEKLNAGHVPACNIDLSKKNITLDKIEKDNIIKVLIDGETIWNLFYECRFLMHPMMPSIYAPCIHEIIEWKNAKKAPPPPAMPAPPPYNRG